MKFKDKRKKERETENIIVEFIPMGFRQQKYSVYTEAYTGVDSYLGSQVVLHNSIHLKKP